MVECKTAVSPLLMHWRYHSLALNHRNNPYSSCSFSSIISLRISLTQVIPFQADASFKLTRQHRKVGTPHTSSSLMLWQNSDVIMGSIASQITSLTIVYSTVYSGADQREHQSSASLAFVWGIHRGQVNSPHKWPVTRKMFPFDDVIMERRFFASR